MLNGNFVPLDFHVLQIVCFRHHTVINSTALNQLCSDIKVHGANMGHIWVLSAPDGPYVCPMNLAMRVVFAARVILGERVLRVCWCMWSWRRHLVLPPLFTANKQGRFPKVETSSIWKRVPWKCIIHTVKYCQMLCSFINSLTDNCIAIHFIIIV